MAKSDRIKAPRGMPDTLPEAMPLMARLETAARKVFGLYGFEEIRTPLFEETRLFKRGIGEATDIVEKEMYTFGDTGDGDSITLRPEGTASVVRAAVEHNLLKKQGFWKLFYIGPMFRKERPQAGRLRQFDQIGVEALGSEDPSVDAENIILAARYFEEIGLKDVKVQVNSIGSEASRGAYREVLKQLFDDQRDKLCPDCQSRYDRNVFRILDCKVRQCKEIAAQAPAMRDHLNTDDGAHFDAVLALLDAAGLEYVVDDRLVRGFDYYTRTVFELSHESLGARSAICGGGRYDNLVGELGGPDAGCVGFAVGVVPTILAMHKTLGEEAVTAAPLTVYAVAVNNDVRNDVFRIVEQLRAAGISADRDSEGRSLKAQMRSANKGGAVYTLVVGPDEVASGTYNLKHMESSDEQKLSVEEIISQLQTL
jgi:histidyl-tRNA synthetase